MIVFIKISIYIDLIIPIDSRSIRLITSHLMTYHMNSCLVIFVQLIDSVGKPELIVVPGGLVYTEIGEHVFGVSIPYHEVGDVVEGWHCGVASWGDLFKKGGLVQFFIGLGLMKPRKAYPFLRRS